MNLQRSDVENPRRVGELRGFSIRPAFGGRTAGRETSLCAGATSGKGSIGQLSSNVVDFEMDQGFLTMLRSGSKWRPPILPMD